MTFRENNLCCEWWYYQQPFPSSVPRAGVVMGILLRGLLHTNIQKVPHVLSHGPEVAGMATTSHFLEIVEAGMPMAVNYIALVH